jgi:hypothetical protein
MANVFKLSPKIYLITTIAVISILTAVTGTFFLLVLNFDGIEFNGDSYVYFTNAKHFSTAVSAHGPPMPAYWPYGYPALLSLSFALGDVSFESARWVNVILGGLLGAVLCSILFFISIIKKMSFNQTLLVILSVGLLPLGHGFFLKYQLIIMSDMTALFLDCLVMLLCWWWRASDRLIYIILAGAVLGLSVLTRYVNALMLIPALVVLFCDFDFQQMRSVRSILLTGLLFVGSALLAFAPQLYITLQNTSSSLGNGLLNGWDLKNFYTMTHESMDGHQPAKIPSVLYYFVLPFRWQCFTPFGIILAGLGIKYTFRELPRWIWLSMIIWYLTFYILLCGIPLQNGRIGFPLFLPIVIWMSLGLLESSILWTNRFSKILVVVSLIWCVSFAFSFKAIWDFIKVKNKLKETAQLIAKAIPPESRIVTTSPCAVYQAYPIAIKPFNIYKMSVAETKKLFITEPPMFLAIDEKKFIPQFTHYPPGKSLDWIKSNYSCIFKFNIGDFTVYEIKPHVRLSTREMIPNEIQ